MSSGLYQIEKLDDNNYDAWKLLMKSVLVHSDLWDYVSGDKLPPTDVDQLIAWNAKDQKALATLLLCVKSSQLLHVKNAATSKDAWSRLAEVHSPRGPARKVTIFKSLVNLKMCEESSMTEHLAKFYELFEKLTELDIKLQDELLAIIMLSSLPKSYESFIIAIESRDVLPCTSVLKTKLIEEEKRRMSEKEEPNQTAFFTSKQQTQAQKQTTQVQQNKTQNTKPRGKCYKCHKKGHHAASCWSNNTGKQNINCAMLNISTHSYAQLNSSVWIIDSGTTSHMCCDKAAFRDITAHREKIELVGNKFIFSEGIGVVCVETENSKLFLHDVLYIPYMRSNFISVSKLTERGCRAEFGQDFARIKAPNGVEVMRAQRIGNLFTYKSKLNKLCVAKVAHESNSEWHRKYGHLNMASLEQLSKMNMVRGLNIKSNKQFECDVCLKGKISALPFPKNLDKPSKHVLEIVHSDVCGPMNVKSLSGAQYFVSFVDDFSRKIFVYFIKNKSEVFEKFRAFKSTVERETGKQLKILHTDNGREYVNRDFNDFLTREGIQKQLAVPYTPQQNGIAERVNRTLVEMARCMLIESKLPESLWAEAINTSVYLRNRSPTKMLYNVTPHEAWCGKKPSVSHLKVFGTRGVVLDKIPRKSKFVAKGKECLMVGYASESKAYRLYDPEKRTVIIGRDVRFLRSEIGHRVNALPDDPPVPIMDNIPNRIKDIKIFTVDENTIDDVESDTVICNSGDISAVVAANYRDPDEDPDEDSSEVRGEANANRLRFQMKLRPRKPVSPHINNFIMSSCEERKDDPLTVKDALERSDADKWKSAMLSEYNSLVKNETWELVDVPIDRKPIKSKWVFHLKRDKNGVPLRYKARLVAKGCSQRYGVDYNEIFSPVVRYSSIRLILALAAEHDLFIHQMDVSSAYLNGPLEEEVFMSQPECFVDSDNKNKVCKLKKALYGLKQSGRNWNQELDRALTNIGYVKCNGDACVYVRNMPGETNILAVYVDDILLACSSLETLSRIKYQITQQFAVVDKGPVDHFLGMEIIRSQEGIQVSQKQLIRELLDEFGLGECRSCTTPLDPGTKFEKCTDCSECVKVNQKEYQSLMGSLTYLGVCTRPDIVHSVSKLAQFNTNPHVEHLNAAKHLLRYLNTTLNLKLNYFQTGAELKGFVDADWGGNGVDRKSYTGFAFFLAGAAISWESRKQSTIALSSTEAEYVALSMASKEAVYLRNFLKEMGFNAAVKGPTELFNDNLSAQKLARNPVFHNRTKHIDIKAHYIREVAEKGFVDLKYTPTDKMIADIFTKNLKKIKHIEFTNMLGLVQ